VLSLDFSPHAVHAPINMGVRKGRDRDAGARLEIRELAGGPDAVRLVASGRVDLGVLDVHDLASARQQAPTSWPSGHLSGAYGLPHPAAG
jgi:putative hydroxymethylpyrimidine transport system substrate-binding protein